MSIAAVLAGERTWHVEECHVLDGLRALPDESIHCVVTSPPYWALRDYGLPPVVWGGSPDCEHDFGPEVAIIRGGAHGDKVLLDGGRGTLEGQASVKTQRAGAFCTRCNAWLGCYGLERTPELFVQHTVLIFREVRRVLRSDGTLWLNIGDTYATGAGKCDKVGGRTGANGILIEADAYPVVPPNRLPVVGLKKKDRVGIPWRVALALQADGWYWRDEIIWCKRSPMPESCRDRTTKAHEPILLLTKQPTYFYDRYASREKAAGTAHDRSHSETRKHSKADPSTILANGQYTKRIGAVTDSRNMRSFWVLSSEPYKGKHFAVMPREIVRKCLLAATSEKGCCPRCGAPWRRILKRERVATRPGTNSKTRIPSGWDTGPGSHNELTGYYDNGQSTAAGKLGKPDPLVVGNRDPYRHTSVLRHLGWQPSCECVGVEPGELVPCVVLDPFNGRGTVALVARKLNNRAIGLELNPDDVVKSRKRIASDAPLFNA